MTLYVLKFRILFCSLSFFLSFVLYLLSLRLSRSLPRSTLSPYVSFYVYWIQLLRFLVIHLFRFFPSSFALFICTTTRCQWLCCIAHAQLPIIFIYMYALGTMEKVAWRAAHCSIAIHAKEYIWEPGSKKRHSQKSCLWPNRLEAGIQLPLWWNIEFMTVEYVESRGISYTSNMTCVFVWFLICRN